MAKKIVFVSGKGGVGKTTVVSNLGVQLAKRGKNVVLIDADIGLNNLDVVMGVENKVVYDILDVLEGRCRLKQALIKGENLPSLSILASAHFGAGHISAAEMRLIVANLDSLFDYVLIDSPAGIDNGFHRAVSGAGEAYVIVSPNISSVRDADKVISLLNTYRLDNVGLIINRVRGDLIMLGETMSVDDITKLLKIIPTGVIPEDDEVSLCTCIGRAVEGNGEAAEAFSLLAENFLTGRNKQYDCLAKYKTFWGRVKLKKRAKA